MENLELKYALYECKVACDLCVEETLHHSDAYRLKNLINVTKVCAMISLTAVKILSYGFTHDEGIVNICHKLCLECAEISGDYATTACRVCAQKCNAAATLCQQYLQYHPEMVEK
ncbi:hypothetical protein ACG2LH_18075 [Zhouia sp. PK063]|uniref:hypothetical protein n=1 Tax=Zhouia sp. PK063 TaxID=3373602 RepID=UPI00378957E0